MIQVFLVDDHPVVRAGIRYLLQGKVEIVGEAETGQEALLKIPQARPQVVILDIALPDMDGIQVAERLKALYPEAQLLALSMYAEPEYAERFLQAGGSGYLPKDVIEQELEDAVLAVARGEHYLPQNLLYRMIQAQTVRKPGPEVLTERELMVVRYLAQGLSYKEIAEAMGISEKTVATYRERAAEKLGLRSRAELVRWAVEEKLV
ncbi:DNA-binding response regulator [Thermus thermophilus]|uniref:DNA-binding response regulator n=2 Tax=Thermus thermophilus TaxID=274 RepID=A0AAD1KWF8_THETH|nr:response regulator transcription factor [Thermus thermophilus]BCZ87392.1 DNA-binding response regulator [Thermus thermophilus]BCZ92413.1 DNA-binding response regulator [Thermus thermophilus]